MGWDTAPPAGSSRAIAVGGWAAGSRRWLLPCVAATATAAAGSTTAQAAVVVPPAGQVLEFDPSGNQIAAFASRR
jgi:hypothetical protein